MLERLVISMVTFLRLLRLAAKASADSLMLLLLVKSATKHCININILMLIVAMIKDAQLTEQYLSVNLQTQQRNNLAHLFGSRVHCSFGRYQTGLTLQIILVGECVAP